MANSRIKDYLDLWVMLDREKLDPAVLAMAIAATFSRRGSRLPANLPVGLTEEFANDLTRQGIWKAFLLKNDLTFKPLPEIVEGLASRLHGALAQAHGLAPAG